MGRRWNHVGINIYLKLKGIHVLDILSMRLGLIVVVVGCAGMVPDGWRNRSLEFI